MGDDAYGINRATIVRMVREVQEITQLGCEVAVVIGGGNIFRGVSGAAAGLDRARADYMGMLATVLNALAMQGALDRQGLDTRVMSAIPMPSICEPFQRDAALDHLRHGRVVLFAAGTGNPFFTTDTAAALRAVEMNCNAMLKGTSVDGIYEADPKMTPDAHRFDVLSYQEVLSRNLKVMDTAAIALARDNRIPVIVFSIRTEGALPEVLKGQGRFTIVRD